MEIVSTCLMFAAVVHVTPNTTQFFWYDNVMLSCSVPAHSGVWVLWRNTSFVAAQPCSSNGGWGEPRPLACAIAEAYPSDSGTYWCESEEGQRSSSVNIIVTGGEVILESPAHPVTEGDAVTLLCSHKDGKREEVSRNFSSNFYKDGVQVGAGVGGLTLPHVSRSDAGLYKCDHPNQGESPQSWLDVQVAPPPATPPPCLLPWPMLAGILLMSLHATMIVVILILTHTHTIIEA